MTRPGKEGNDPWSPVLKAGTTLLTKSSGWSAYRVECMKHKHTRIAKWTKWDYFGRAECLPKDPDARKHGAWCFFFFFFFQTTKRKLTCLLACFSTRLQCKTAVNFRYVGNYPLFTFNATCHWLQTEQKLTTISHCGQNKKAVGLCLTDNCSFVMFHTSDPYTAKG